MTQHNSASASAGAALHEPGAEFHPNRRFWTVCASLPVVISLSAMDWMIVGTALFTIVGDLGGAVRMAWILTAYTLVIAVAMSIYDKLGDLVRRKNLFPMAIALFLIGSVPCSTADSMTQLAIYRFIQGLGDGGLMTSSQAITGNLIPPRVYGTYVAPMGAMFDTASILGPIVGDQFANSTSWRWAFWTNPPLGVLIFIAIFLMLRLPSSRLISPIDWQGLRPMSVGTIAIVLMATWGGSQYTWISPVVIGLGVISLARWGLFGSVETRTTDPILPWTILTSRTLIVSTLVGMLAMGSTIGVLGYLSVYLQMVYGYSAITSGLLPVPIIVGMFTSSVLSDVFVSRTDRYETYPVTGSLAATSTVFWLSRLLTTSLVWQVFTVTFPMRADIGLFSQLLVTAMQNALPAKHLGAVTSGDNFFREVDISLGASPAGAALSSSLTSSLTDRTGALVRGAGPITLREPVRFKNADTSSLTPTLVSQLPITLHDAATGSYVDTLLSTSGWMIPLFVVTSTVALSLPEVLLFQEAIMKQVAEAEAEDEPSGPTSPQKPDSTPQQAEQESTGPVMTIDAE